MCLAIQLLQNLKFLRTSHAMCAGMGDVCHLIAHRCWDIYAVYCLVSYGQTKHRLAIDNVIKLQLHCLTCKLNGVPSSNQPLSKAMIVVKRCCPSMTSKSSLCCSCSQISWTGSFNKIVSISLLLLGSFHTNSLWYDGLRSSEPSLFWSSVSKLQM